MPHPRNPARFGCRLGGARSPRRASLAAVSLSVLSAALAWTALGASLAASAEPGPKAAPAEARKALDKALRDLRAALVSRDSEAVRKAGVAVSQIGGAAAMKEILDLVSRIPPSDDAVYWSLLASAASFVDRSALEVLGKAIRSGASKPLARDLLYALADNPSPACAAALAPVLKDGPSDLRILAVTKLARMHVPAAVDALIAVLAEEEKSRRGEPSLVAAIAAEGLAAMTGQEFGTSSVNWRGWWEKNRDKPLRAPGETVASHTGTAVDSLRLDRIRREGFVGVEKAPPEAIVVLTAVYTKRLQRDLNNDKIEDVLERMRIPHTVVRREDFATYDLSKAGALLVNCAQFHEFCICPDCKPGGDKHNRLYRCTGCNKHIPFSAKLGDPEVKKIAAFVQRGGYLFCEDWTVKEILERAFPDFVSAGAVLKEDNVDVVPARGMATHPYLRGIYSPRPIGRQAPAWYEDLEEPGERVVQEGEDEGSGKTAVVGRGEIPEVDPEGVRVRHTWRIDDESWALKVADPSRVLALLASGKLQRTAEGQGLVALAFRPSKGQGASISGDGRPAPGAPGVVMAVLSHFGKQESVADEYAIQNLLLNFLIDASVGRPREPKKRDGSRRRRGRREALLRVQGVRPREGRPPRGRGRRCPGARCPLTIRPPGTQ